jgi:hypothetical protein
VHWVYEGRAWNEAYLLRAFLQYNRTFQIEFFSSYAVHRHRDVFESRMPLFLKNDGGNIWLKKTQLDSKLDRINEKIARKARPLPGGIEPALPENRWLLDEGWHWGEGDHCWMAGRASVRLAGPHMPSQQLRIRGYNPHAGGARLSVTVDEFVLPPLQCTSEGAVNAPFSLPAQLIGRREIKIQLEVDRTFHAPHDPRTLGFMVEEIEVR